MSEHPYKVRTTDGTLAGECDTEAHATASAAERNARAEAIGIATRYVVDVDPPAEAEAA